MITDIIKDLKEKRDNCEISDREMAYDYAITKLEELIAANTVVTYEVKEVKGHYGNPLEYDTLSHAEKIQIVEGGKIFERTTISITETHDKEL